ncbi:MAG TPA: hypothetical protein VEO54_09940 [Thermoanaerobaculia bacterium]|nr:hypothetical protein [Thermoanaerobaculia bacterium]
MKGWKAYRSLNAEQKRALRAKRIEMNRPAGALLEFLKPLAACDAMSDKFRTTLGCTFAFTLAATIVLALIYATNGWPEGWWTIVVPPALFAIFAGWGWSWTRSVDISNNFRKFALPVLTVLREDFDPARPVHVRLDLAAPTAPSKKRGKDEAVKKGGRKVVNSRYVDAWMSVEGVLVDGTKLAWRVTDAIRESKRTKRNARGKIKTKTKYKKKSTIEVSMGLKKKSYELRKALGEVAEDERRNTVSLSRRVVTASLDPIDPRVLLDLVASIFRNTRPAKEAGA